MSALTLKHDGRLCYRVYNRWDALAGQFIWQVNDWRFIPEMNYEFEGFELEALVNLYNSIKGRPL